MLREIVDGDGAAPSREEVAAELIVFVRETVRELGERRAAGFLKKFYGWYLGRGRFPKPFKQELVQLASTEEVVTRLLAAAPAATPPPPAQPTQPTQPSTPETTETRPGWGNGDENHEHTGPGKKGP